MTDNDFDDIISAGFTDGDYLEVPVKWRLTQPPSRVAVPLVSLSRPRSGQPVVFRQPLGDGTTWLSDFVLRGHTVQTVELEGMDEPTPCVTLVDANGWEAAAYGYAAPTRLCPIEWAYAYTDENQPAASGDEDIPPVLTPQPAANVGTLLGRMIRCQMPYEAEEMQQGKWTCWRAVTEVIVNPDTGDRVVGLTSPDEWAAVRYGNPEPGLPHVWYCAVEEAWTY